MLNYLGIFKPKEKTMYELIQHLIAFKYACKVNHWSTDNYSKHLLFDRLSEDIDTWVDEIAETYFMASDNKKIFKFYDLYYSTITNQLELKPSSEYLLY